jgi:pilus assembly protein CpaB
MIRILILVFALGSGGLAAWLALAGQKQDVPHVAVIEPVEQKPLQEVLVATADFAQGHALDELSMRWQHWPEKAVAAGIIVRSARPHALDELKGLVVRTPLFESEPIRDAKLVQAGSGYLSALLSSGKRAVAVRITAENTAGGFILPDDRVDVVHTTSKSEVGDGEVQTISNTIMTNVRVLAVDQVASQSDIGEAVVGRTATLELDLRQVEAITAAESSGTLSLALRSVADNDDAPTFLNKNNSRVVRVIRSGRTELVQIRRTDG